MIYFETTWNCTIPIICLINLDTNKNEQQQKINNKWTPHRNEGKKIIINCNNYTDLIAHFANALIST